jgi:hypothetical protein
MSELYLSCAAFAFYVTKHGYKFSPQGDGWISLWLSEKSHPFQIMVNEKISDDCGYLVTNLMDLNEIFRAKQTLLVTLTTVCIRDRQKLSDGRISHCSIDKSSHGSIQSYLGEKTINCLQPPL